MNLIVGAYREPDNARHAELSRVLRANVANPHFARVVVLEEDPGALEAYELGETTKLRLVPIGQRATFDDAFRVAHAFAVHQTSPDVAVIANADIEFDGSISLAERLPRNELWCVTRTELDGRFPEHAPWSQDAWIFRPPLPPFPAPWHFGVPACDNRLAYEAARAGLVLRNPARQIRCKHHHGSNVRRTGDRRLDGDALAVAIDD